MDYPFQSIQRIEGFDGNLVWYQRGDYFYTVYKESFSETNLRCADENCPARWNQRKYQSYLARVYPEHNHIPHTWMRDRYPVAVKYMPMSVVESSLRNLRRQAMWKKLDMAADDVEFCEDNRADTFERKDTCGIVPHVNNPKIQASNFLTVLPQLQNQLCSNNSILVSVGGSNVATTVPQNPMYTTNTTHVTQLGDRSSGFFTAVPQMINPLCPLNTVLIPQIQAQSSNIVTAIPQPQNSLCSTVPSIFPPWQTQGSITGKLEVSDLGTTVPQLEDFMSSSNMNPELDDRGSDLDTIIPQLHDSADVDPELEDQCFDLFTVSPKRQDPLFEKCKSEKVAVDPDPAPRTEDPLYQLSDTNVHVLPQGKSQFVKIAPAPRTEDPLCQLSDNNVHVLPQGKSQLVKIAPAPRTEDPLCQLSDNNVHVLPQGKSQFVKIAPAPRTQDSLYQLSDNNVHVLPQGKSQFVKIAPVPPRVKESAKVCLITCRACSSDVPYYVFIPCGHVICRKCFERLKVYRLCFKCRITIDSALRILF